MQMNLLHYRQYKLYYKKKNNLEKNTNNNRQKLNKVKFILRMRKKLYFLFKSNLYTFKTFFKKKIYNVEKYKKIFKKISKFSQYQLCIFFEFFLFNIILKSHFAITYSDAIYLIQNGYIFINGKKQTNILYKVDLYDNIQTLLFNNIYLHNRKKFVDLYKLIKDNKYKISRYYRSKKRLFTTKTHIASEKNQKLMYYNLKIPNYLEVDYMLMSAVVIMLPNNFKHFNYYYFKYIPIYLNRSFIWRITS